MTFFKKIIARNNLTDRLSQQAKNHHYKDVLATKITKTELTPSQLQHGIYSYMPAWVSLLMKIRNKMVGLLGFHTGNDDITPVNDELEVVDTAGFLTIVEKYDNEIIGRSEDRHMEFFLSVAKEENLVIVTTLVNPKTRIGRVYIRCILPFHYIIARSVINSATNAGRI